MGRIFNRINKKKFKKFGNNVRIDSSNKVFGVENIEIGDNVYIGFGGSYSGQGGLVIGNGSILAHNISIMTRNHNYDSEDLQSIPYDTDYENKPVIIKENVWIGANVCILPGITIEEGAVIGMGAVVTKDVPKGAIVGGNPAKILKYRDLSRYEELKSQDKVYLKLKNN